MKVKGEVSGELDVKRLRLPGITIVGKCLKCDTPVTEEFDGDAFNYPVAGEVNDYYVLCSECDTCNIVKLQFNVSVEVRGVTCE